MKALEKKGCIKLKHNYSIWGKCTVHPSWPLYFKENVFNCIQPTLLHGTHRKLLLFTSFTATLWTSRMWRLRDWKNWNWNLIQSVILRWPIFFKRKGLFSWIFINLLAYAMLQDISKSFGQKSNFLKCFNIIWNCLNLELEDFWGCKKATVFMQNWQFVVILVQFFPSTAPML